MVKKQNAAIVERNSETTYPTRSKYPTQSPTPQRPGTTGSGSGSETTGRSQPQQNNDIPHQQQQSAGQRTGPGPTSPSPHQQYLDSLQPPSPRDFARLRNLQEDRVRERTQRNNKLRRQDKVAARKSMEARRDFMCSKALIDETSQPQSWSQSQQAAPSSSSHHHNHHHDDAHSHSFPPSLSSRIHRPLGPGSQMASTGSGSEKNSDGGTREDVSDEKLDAGHLLRAKAATVIQRTYRGYRVRREMQGLGLDASTRWTHAIRDAQWKELTRPRARDDPATLGSSVARDGSDREGKGTGTGSGRSSSTGRLRARQNWKKAAAIARRAGGDEDSDHSVSSDDSSAPDSGEWEHMSPEERDAVRRKRRKAQLKRRKHARMMGLQYFLEMVDLQHRYGSNLRTYHEEWKRSDTNENFFYWLDYGEGKNMDLATCPRERLDRERVRYLNREERQHYLVKVDNDGRLVWAKNGVRIDTTEEWKDSIHGIVPADDPTPAYSPEIEKHIQNAEHSSTQDQNHHGHHHHSPNEHTSGSQSSSSISPSRQSELEAAMAAKYANPDLDNAKGAKKLKHVSAATIFNKLLRKSVRKNTWIFVADTSFRLYVGIKASGAFQHSSFLHGSRISAAGLIKVKDGRLSSLSPLSGHYRPPASNFRAFVHSLEDEGVDMSHVSISRSYAVLFGLEIYVKTRRKGKEVLRRMRQTTRVFRPDERTIDDDDDNDDDEGSESAARETVLDKVPEDEEKKREENKASVRIMQKLSIRPRTPYGQQDGKSAAVEEGNREQKRPKRRSSGIGLIG